MCRFSLVRTLFYRFVKVYFVKVCKDSSGRGLNMDRDEIQDEMERQRRILHQMADQYGFMDERVLVQSQKLDEWLNEFERHKYV
ncbi:hypothetical protein B9G55_17210 [Saccharibacillus sp. O16]|nr:hypothetical protein B9G55_17210 [Saccharibacillus sp. O16]